VEVVFDMERSGATLAWARMHGDKPCWLVDYAEDRDLWRHKLPRSREVNAYLSAAPKTFAAYDKAFEAGPDVVAGWGEGCLTWIRYYVDSVKQLHRRMPFLGYDDIPVVNAPYTATSEVVGELAEDALFAVGWHVRADGKVVYSLRSRGDFSVEALAKTMGGGGHVKAAGFQSSKTPDALAEAI
jgi:oligoribonuclease NrnB/cAMP/cGMP phosphodiesterase (DHH superfamily)